jgi:UDP-glucose 4-epimerase
VLLRAMKKHGCPSLIFSSSATVYGLPKSVPITEDFPIQPTNPCALDWFVLSPCRLHV